MSKSMAEDQRAVYVVSYSLPRCSSRNLRLDVSPQARHCSTASLAQWSSRASLTSNSNLSALVIASPLVSMYSTQSQSVCQSTYPEVQSAPLDYKRLAFIGQGILLLGRGPFCSSPCSVLSFRDPFRHRNQMESKREKGQVKGIQKDSPIGVFHVIQIRARLSFVFNGLDRSVWLT